MDFALLRQNGVKVATLLVSLLLCCSFISGMSVETRQVPEAACDEAASAPSGITKIYSSGYSEQIWQFNFNPANGQISVGKKMQANPNLSFMEFGSDGSLFAIHEVQWFEGNKDGGLSRWKLLPATHWNGIQKVEAKRTLGWGPAHVAVDEENKFIYVANYGGGSFTAFKLNADFSIGSVMLNDVYGRGSGADPEGRQAASHAHGTSVFGRHVYVVDLGSDKIFHYEVRRPGEVIIRGTPTFTATPPASGPRHMAIHKQKGIAYVIYELKNLIQSYKIDSATGDLTHLGDFTLLPDEIYNQPGVKNYGAEIAVHPNGRFLYCSNRGHGAIVAFAIGVDGGLTRIQLYALEGTWPRHFLIHPEGRHILVAEQFKNRIQVLGLDPSNGHLTKGATVGTQNAPTVLAIAP